MIPFDYFEGQSSDGRFVPIVPGGRAIPLTFQNRQNYVERATAYRLQEMDLQILAMREGMSWLVPVPLLSLMTAHALEQQVCGMPQISIDVLQKGDQVPGDRRESPAGAVVLGDPRRLL